VRKKDCLPRIQGCSHFFKYHYPFYLLYGILRAQRARGNFFLPFFLFLSIENVPYFGLWAEAPRWGGGTVLPPWGGVGPKNAPPPLQAALVGTQGAIAGIWLQTRKCQKRRWVGICRVSFFTIITNYKTIIKNAKPKIVKKM